MKTKFAVALLASAALLGSVGLADAKVLGLRAQNGSTTQQTTSPAFSTASGAWSQSNVINGVTYTINTTSTEATNLITLTLGNNSSAATPPKTVIYWASVTGLTPQPSIQSWSDLLTAVNPISATPPPPHPDTAELMQVWYDPGNHLFGNGAGATLLYDSGTGCGSTAAVSCSGGGPISLASTFALTEIMTIAYKTGSAGQTVTANNTLSLVPEPTSLAMLGSGLLLAGFMFRRRRNGKA